MSQRRDRIILAALLVLGCALRLQGLGTHSIWIDEAGTLYVAHADDMVGALRGDRHPPLSFMLFRAWSSLVGEDDGALRLLPALASCVSLVLFARLARAKAEPRAALVAVASCAVAPLSIWMAQEVRMYAFVELAAVASFVALQGWIERPRRPLVLVVGTACALATGLHYFGAFVAVSVALQAWIAAARKQCSARNAWIATLAASVGTCAWIPWIAGVMPDQISQTAGFLAKTGFRALAELPARLALVGSEFSPDEWTPVLYATAAVILLGVSACAWRAVRERNAGAADALALVYAPPAAALTAALFGPLNFIARYFAAAIPGVHLSVAIGLDGVRSRALRVTLVAVLLGGALSSALVLASGNAREDWRGACAAVAAEWKDGDRILALTHLADGYSEAPLRHYMRARPELLDALVTRGDIAAWNSGTLGPGHRLHVVYRETSYASQSYQDICRRFHVVERTSMGHGLERLVLD